MISAHPTQILALLRSGEKVEIGGGSSSSRSDGRKAASSRIPLLLGFATIYLIWGSTYLGIRYAVETIPPYLMMGLRHFTAGALVYAWARWRGAPGPTIRQWGYAVVAGGILFVGGHGTLAWAEQRIPSGLAALLCATLPLWTVLLARLDGTEPRLGPKALAGILVGFGGVALLIGPGALGQRLDLLAAGTALLSALLWAAGTAYTRRAQLPSSKLLSAAMQMLSGGTLLLITGVLIGEGHQMHVAALTTRSVLALVYLIVLGSIIAFSVYTWLIGVSSPSMLSTYAYVNPVVAVFLGWIMADEAVGPRTILATVVILAGVALVSRRSKPASTVLPSRRAISVKQACEAAVN